MVLQKDVTTKSKYLKEMHMAIVILKDLGIEFYMYLTIKRKKDNTENEVA